MNLPSFLGSPQNRELAGGHSAAMAEFEASNEILSQRNTKELSGQGIRRFYFNLSFYISNLITEKEGRGDT